MAVEKARQYLPLFSEYESTTQSPFIQSYFRSEGFMNAVYHEIQGLLRDRNLRVDHPREFAIMRDRSEKDGQWGWSLMWWRNELLFSRMPFTDHDQDNVRRILTEILSNQKIYQTIVELFRLNHRIEEEVERFKGELKVIVDHIHDTELNYILQGRCNLGF